MRKTLKNIILVFVFIVAAVWFFQKVKLIPSFRDIFAAKAIVIDETPILIKEIRSIAELITITSFDEVVVDSTILSKTADVVNAFNRIGLFPMLPSPEKTLVLVVKGKVLAGTDLSKLGNGDIHIKGDTLDITLPKAKILEVITNPSGFETFEEKGSWTNEEVTAVKLRARQKLTERAVQKDILQKADLKAAAVIESFIKTAGYKVVIVGRR